MIAWRRAVWLAWAWLGLAGCARVIGLGDGYYLVPDEAGGGGAGGASAGNAGTVGDGGSAAAGTTAVGGSGGSGGSVLCSDHPITVKSSWVASASDQFNGNPPSDLIDNSKARWSTGKPQAGDEWLQIDFGASVNISGINLQQGVDNSNDYPRMYAVYVSDTDRDLTGAARASGVGNSGVSTAIKLPKIFSGRYLLIKQLGSSLSWWSVEELEVSCADT